MCVIRLNMDALTSDVADRGDDLDARWLTQGCGTLDDAAQRPCFDVYTGMFRRALSAPGARRP